MAKIVIGPECWAWNASHYPNGYGQFHPRKGVSSLAHRAVYELFAGPIPLGMVVMHTCDNRGCVRPTHLRLGTQAENMQDMHAKGRAGRRPGRPRQETCRNGHDDWYVSPSGGRTCRPCRRASVNAWAARRRQSK